MHERSIHYTIRRLLPIILIVIAAGIWWHTYRFYAEHRSAIWLQAGDVMEAITFPYKLAELYAQPPLTDIPVPVHGVLLRDIADTWGEARSLGREHEGVDIFAPRGTPVYAATPGYVVRTGENALGGTVVFTVGPSGIRYYYAHLESIAEGIEFGTQVTTDTVLGFVGNSGNASATPPHLHFGIYDNGAHNPYPFLRERE
jgi:peptidoglycan LD-endopeptidase LytH